MTTEKIVKRLRPGDDVPQGLSDIVIEGPNAGYYQLYFRPTAGGPFSISMLFYESWSYAFKKEVSS